MYNIQVHEILETVMGENNGEVLSLLQNLRARHAAPPMTVEASAEVMWITAAVAARRPSVVGHAHNPLHSLGCEVKLILLYAADMPQIFLRYYWA
jgi:hypothetical protein